MVFINLKNLIESINLVGPLIKSKIERNEYVINILKKYHLDPEHPPADFTAVYAYTLVEYGIGKPLPVLELFRRDEICTAFRDAFNQNNYAILQNEGELFLKWNKLGDEIRQIGVDPRREFAAFNVLFNNIVDCTRMPNEVKLERKIDTISTELNKILDKLDNLEIEEIRSEIDLFLQNHSVRRKQLTIDDILKTFPNHLYAFTKDNLNWKINSLRSIFLSNRTYGTVGTAYTFTDKTLLNNTITNILSNKFSLLYGNPGRGKTFYACSLIESSMYTFDVIVYYSPHAHFGKYQGITSVYEPINKILTIGCRLLFIVDDAHLIDQDLKHNLFLQLDDPNNSLLYLLMISRYQEEKVVPIKYLNDKIIINFNKIAEVIFDKILFNFIESHRIERGYDKIRSILEGGNLVFLTLILQSWEILLKQGNDPSFDEIRKHANRRFLGYYERNFTDNWRYINHIVSALFQYEIRIDKNYLSPVFNKQLAKYNLATYLKDRMVHKKLVAEEDENRLFYVFTDFDRGEEKDMMKNASEFRFYLEACERLLAFDKIRNLDHIEFTKLVLMDYVLFRPINIPEVEDRIRKNASRDEQENILKSLYSNLEVKKAIDDARLNILMNGLR